MDGSVTEDDLAIAEYHRIREIKKGQKVTTGRRADGLAAVYIWTPFPQRISRLYGNC